jgi:hypothetical protein
MNTDEAASNHACYATKAVARASSHSDPTTAVLSDHKRERFSFLGSSHATPKVTHVAGPSFTSPLRTSTISAIAVGSGSSPAHDIIAMSPGGTAVFRKRSQPRGTEGSTTASSTVGDPTAPMSGNRVVLLCSDVDDDDLDTSVGRQRSHHGSWRRQLTAAVQHHGDIGYGSQALDTHGHRNRRSSSTPSPDVPPPSSVHVSDTPYPSFSSLLGTATASQRTTSSLSASGSASAVGPSSGIATGALATQSKSALRGWARLCNVAHDDGVTANDLGLVSCDTLHSMIVCYNIIEPDEVALIEAEWALFQQRRSPSPQPRVGTAETVTGPALPSVSLEQSGLTSSAAMERASPLLLGAVSVPAAAAHQPRSISTRSVSFDRGGSTPPPSPYVSTIYDDAQLHRSGGLLVRSERAGAAQAPAKRMTTSLGFSHGSLKSNTSGGISPVATTLLQSTVAVSMQSPSSVTLPVGDPHHSGGALLRASPIPPAASPSPMILEYSTSIMPPRSGSIARALFVNAPQALRSYSQQSSATTAYFSAVGGGNAGDHSHQQLQHSASWRSSAASSAASSYRRQSGFDTALSADLQHKVRLSGHKKLLGTDVRRCTSDPNVPLHPQPFEHPTGLRSIDMESRAKYSKSLQSSPSGTKRLCDRRPSLAPKDHLFGGGHA